MIFTRAGLVNQSEIETAVRKVEKEFAPNVVNINHSFGEDVVEAPAVFFRILVRDEAAPIARLKGLAQRISLALMNEAKTDENDLPRELLDSARSLHQVIPATQATLRRAVSTAYYALFHFLVEEACANWTRPEQRHALARTFIHRHMFEVSSNRRSRQ
jgi:hypothetical protein